MGPSVFRAVSSARRVVLGAVAGGEDRAARRPPWLDRYL